MTFGLLTLLTAAGLAGPLLAGLPRSRVPLVVGELAAGVVLGRTGLHVVDPAEPTTAFLSDVGFAMLMFVLGTRLPLRHAGFGRAARPAALATALTFALAGPAGVALALLGPHRPAVLAVLVASSSAAVALPILRGHPDDPAMGFAVAWITFTDIATVLAVPVVLATGALPRVLAGGALVLAAGVAALLVLRALRRTDRFHDLRRQSKRQGWALDLRVGLTVLFGLAAVATAFGTSILVAGFTAGAVLAATGEPRRLAQQLVGVAEGFLVPLFFVTLGARLELGALLHSGRALFLAGGLVVAATAVHVAAVLVLRRPAAVGLLGTAALGVPSAVVSIGLAEHVLDAGQAAALLAAALGTIAVSAAGGALLGAHQARAER